MDAPPCDAGGLLTALDPASVVHALAWLGARDLAAFGAASRAARDLANDDVLWRAYAARNFPGRVASGVAPTEGCWRLEAYVLKRAQAYQRAYAQGRAGRIVSAELPAIDRVSIFDSGAAAAARLARRIEPVAPVAGLHDAGCERRFARQGTCSWSILGRAPAGGRDAGEPAAAGTSAAEVIEGSLPGARAPNPAS